MKNIKIDCSMITRDPAEAAKVSKNLEDLGYDGAYTFEGPHEPFLPLAAAALSTEKLELSTSIAVAFSRNPMTLANIGYDLQLMSKGRFTLGLGSQIKPHIEKRYSMPWTSPAKRMKEMVNAIKAIWECWHEGKDLNFRGEFYQHTLMTPFFNPGENPFGLPKIYVAGVGPLMTQAAAEAGDGFIVHPFHTSIFLESITLPSIEKGLKQVNKKEFDISVGVMVATGMNDQEIEDARNACKSQIGFYGSTPAYKTVLEQHGWESIQPELNKMTKKGLWKDIPSLITDEMLEAISVSGTPSQVAKKIYDRYKDIATRIAPSIFSGDPEVTSELIGLLKKIK
ncbi:TIGR03617 family F420-dependent LLM class oxidoreductase [Gammaproteobacteria bacterium]|jgi:probable F420-dependent oxidoreductase|nr:TIGR03617 family F420-dependent LLM class oxidoreductase [Gammaproteobacteria bacterium]